MNYPREFHPAKYRFHQEKKCVTDCPYCACGWDENVRQAGRVYVDPTSFSGNFNTRERNAISSGEE